MRKLLLFLVFFVSGISVFAAKPFELVPTNGPYAAYMGRFCYDNQNNIVFANSGGVYKLDYERGKWIRIYEAIEKQFGGSASIIYTDSIYFIRLFIGDNLAWSYGLLRSSDYGDTWEEVKNFNYYAYKIIRNENNMFLIGDFGGLLKSTDFGLTWNPTNNGINDTLSRDIQFFELGKIDNNLYLLNNPLGLYRSNDNGKSWTNITKSLPTKSDYNFRWGGITITPDKRLFLHSTTGIYVSSDYGNTWIEIKKGIEDWDYFIMTPCISNQNGDIFVSHYMSGILRLNHDESTWKCIYNGFLNESYCDFFFFNNGNEVLTATSGGIYKSTDSGSSWFYFSKGIDILTTTNCVTIANNGNVLCGTINNGIYSSSDKGNTWNVSNKGILTWNILRLVKDSKGNIYTADDRMNLYKSTDNGDSWDTLSLNYPKYYLRDINLAFDSKDNLL